MQCSEVINFCQNGTCQVISVVKTVKEASSVKTCTSISVAFVNLKNSTQAQGIISQGNSQHGTLAHLVTLQAGLKLTHLTVKALQIPPLALAASHVACCGIDTLCNGMKFVQDREAPPAEKLPGAFTQPSKGRYWWGVAASTVRVAAAVTTLASYYFISIEESNDELNEAASLLNKVVLGCVAGDIFNLVTDRVDLRNLRFK